MTVQAVRPYDELMDEVAKAGGASLYLCYQCGVCTATCPWSEVREVSLRKMLRLAQLGLGGLEGDFLWLCTTCRACVARCPRGVDVIEVIRAARGFVTAMGAEPGPLKTVRGHLSTVHNPWGGKPEERARWADGLGVQRFEPGMDLLLFVGCTAAYDPRIRTVARSLVRVLDAAGVRFGILGNDEVCDGDPALRIGDTEPLLASFDRGQIDEDKVSAVQYLKWQLDERQRDLLKTEGTVVRLSIDHPFYRAQAVVGEDARRAIMNDLD